MFYTMMSKPFMSFMKFLAQVSVQFCVPLFFKNFFDGDTYSVGPK